MSSPWTLYGIGGPDYVFGRMGSISGLYRFIQHGQSRVCLRLRKSVVTICLCPLFPGEPILTEVGLNWQVCVGAESEYFNKRVDLELLVCVRRILETDSSGSWAQIQDKYFLVPPSKVIFPHFIADLQYNCRNIAPFTWTVDKALAHGLIVETFMCGVIGFRAIFIALTNVLLRPPTIRVLT